MKTIILINTFILLWLLPGMTWGQFIAISGYVNDNSGKALENVSIYESNSGIGTISNQNGFYRLVLNDSQVNLQFANKGFKEASCEMELLADTTFIINLEPKILNDENQKSPESTLQAGIKHNKKKTVRHRADFK
jgi:hypothetical protein